MKKMILSLTVLMSIAGTTSSFGSVKSDFNGKPNKECRMDDKDKCTCKGDKCTCKDNKEKCTCNGDCKCDKKDGKKKGRGHMDGRRGPGPGPRIMPTEGCKCATCDSLRVMEQRMQQHMKHEK